MGLLRTLIGVTLNRHITEEECTLQPYQLHCRQHIQTACKNIVSLNDKHTRFERNGRHRKADRNSKSQNGLRRNSGLVKNKLEVVVVMTNTKSRLVQSEKWLTESWKGGIRCLAEIDVFIFATSSKAKSSEASLSSVKAAQVLRRLVLHI